MSLTSTVGFLIHTDPSTSKTNNRDEVVEDQLYPDHPEKMTPQHQFVCGADLNTGVSFVFFYFLINLSVVGLFFVLLL